jgi:hypothetical protein
MYVVGVGGGGGDGGRWDRSLPPSVWGTRDVPCLIRRLRSPHPHQELAHARGRVDEETPLHLASAEVRFDGLMILLIKGVGPPLGWGLGVMCDGWPRRCGCDSWRDGSTDALLALED